MGCPLLKGFSFIEFYGEVIRNFRIVILQVSAVEGCPLSRVPLYEHNSKNPE